MLDKTTYYTICFNPIKNKGYPFFILISVKITLISHLHFMDYEKNTPHQYTTVFFYF